MFQYIKQETNLGLNMNGIQQYQVLAYVDDVNVIGNDIRTTQRNASRDIGLAVNIGKTKYMEVDVIETRWEISIFFTEE